MHLSPTAHDSRGPSRCMRGGSPWRPGARCERTLRPPEARPGRLPGPGVPPSAHSGLRAGSFCALFALGPLAGRFRRLICLRLAGPNGKNATPYVTKCTLSRCDLALKQASQHPRFSPQAAPDLDPKIREPFRHAVCSRVNAPSADHPGTIKGGIGTVADLK